MEIVDKKMFVKSSSILSLAFVWLALLSSPSSSVYAEDQKSPEAESSPGGGEDQQQPDDVQKEEVKPQNTFNAEDHTDWGGYYDPQNVFCGKYDCYKILGFDFEDFGTAKPDTKVITKRYRSLSRVWHPDKSKHKDAKERFVVRMMMIIILVTMRLCSFALFRLSL